MENMILCEEQRTKEDVMKLLNECKFISDQKLDTIIEEVNKSEKVIDKDSIIKLIEQIKNVRKEFAKKYGIISMEVDGKLIFEER